MSLERNACEDLKAFERRLTEIVSCSQPGAIRWRVILAIVSVCLAVTAYYWLSDPLTNLVPLHQSLCNHPFFTLSSLAIIVLMLSGAHRKMVAPSILMSRTREVLSDYHMSCDDTGKLILRPRSVT
jgi:hypothetical protein